MADDCRIVSSSVATLIAVCVVLCYLLCSTPASAWDLRVNPIFKDKYIRDIPIRQIVFIEDSLPTQTLRTLLATGLLIFSEEFTFVDMDWRAGVGELVAYRMEIRSGNTSIMAHPTANVSVEGNLTDSNYTLFRTTLPCRNVDGTTSLAVDLFYDVYNMSLDGSYSLALENRTARLFMRKKCVAVATSQPATTAKKPDITTADTRTQAVTRSPSSGFPVVTAAVAGAGALVVILVLLLIVAIVKFRRTARAERYQRQQESDAYSGPTSMKSNYTRTLRDGPAPLSHEEVGDIMAKLRAEWAENLDGFLLRREIVVLGKEIGRGAFGRVLTGKLAIPGMEPRPVAIKTLKTIGAIADVDEFLEEAVVMKEFDHPNVVALMGVCIEGEEPPLVCLEMMHNGDLRSYLRRSRGLEPQLGPVAELPVSQLLEFCAMILDGMAYLAAQAFVHRDLATRNCMLNKDLVVKIGDFGLARDIHGEDYYVMGTPRRLPVKWMAFESLQDQVFNSLTDVWSFGVVMWEVFSLGQSPYPGVDNSEMIEYLIAGKRMPKPLLCPDEFYNLMQACWNVDKRIRPSFSQLVLMLADIRDSFYDTVEVKERSSITFSNIPKNAERRQPYASTSGSISTVQTELPYTDTSVRGMPINEHTSSVFYSKASQPTEEFQRKRLSQETENPNYSAMAAMNTSSVNPNYSQTEVLASAKYQAQQQQRGYPPVSSSVTPAGMPVTGGSPPRGPVDLPSPVLEETLRSSVSSGSSGGKQRRLSANKSPSVSINEERLRHVQEVDL